MKIHYKLASIVAISSVFLGLLGTVSSQINSKIKKDNKHITNNSLIELENSKEMTRAIQSIEAASQEMLLDRFQVESGERDEAEVTKSLNRIQRKLASFEKSLILTKQANIESIKKEGDLKYGESLTEGEELKLVLKLEKTFMQYKSLIKRYMILVETDPQQAYSFLEREIEPLVKDELLPLVKEYQDDALEELEEITIEIDRYIEDDNRFISGFSIFSLVVSCGIGWSISYQISQRIKKLTTAAEQIAKGKLEPIVLDANENEIELQILARSFNQMIEGVKNSTVSRAYLDNILASMLDSLIVIELDGTIEKVNPATRKLLGYEAEELIGKNINLVLKEEVLHFNVTALHSRFIGNYETFYLSKSSQEIPVTFSSSYLVDSHQRIIGIVCVAKDITEQYLAEQALLKSKEQLLYASLHDRLTGLPNREFLSQELSKLMKTSRSDPNYLFAVLFIDLDRFKIINDSLGHQAGDRLLIAIAKKLKTCIRPGDLVARLGGDEFIILLRKIDNLKTATSIADRIQNELLEPIDLKGHEVSISASIGIALNDCNYDNIENFMRDADTAMYEAKAKGKARYTIFEPTMYEKAKKRLELDKDLRRAIEKNEFKLFYQPIINLTNQKISGFEALLRWQNPLKGLISPGEFIPVAEETGLIVPLGWWILRTACETLNKWQEKYQTDSPLKISVNISAIQFSQVDFIDRITEILELTNLNPQYLQLEITETIIIDNLERANAILQQLKALGITIALDDFGTGYSSLSYLYQLPINTLKIDRCFLYEVEEDSDKLELIKTIIYLGKNLGMDVVAEGIENERQKRILSEHSCDYGQGYLFSKPLPSLLAETLIEQNNITEGLR